MKEYKNKNWLKKQYLDKKLSTTQIAKLCNCGSTTIYRWLKNFDIPIRSLGEAVHLACSNHCNLSEEARQWLDGELLGDGCLYSQSKYSALFSYSSKYKEYIQYISDTLNSFGIKRAGKINKIYHKKMDCYDYNYGSLNYVELLLIRKRWYPNGKKRIPRDLKLTPLLLRQEMIGDGCLIHKKKYRPYIKLATCGFPIRDVEWLAKELCKLGFKTTRWSAGNRICISTHSTKDFLDYIGKCPVKCYEYKFNY